MARAHRFKLAAPKRSRKQQEAVSDAGSEDEDVDNDLPCCLCLYHLATWKFTRKNRHGYHRCLVPKKATTKCSHCQDIDHPCITAYGDLAVYGARLYDELRGGEPSYARVVRLQLAVRKELQRKKAELSLSAAQRAEYEVLKKAEREDRRLTAIESSVRSLSNIEHSIQLIQHHLGDGVGSLTRNARATDKRSPRNRQIVTPKDTLYPQGTPYPLPFKALFTW